MNQLKLVASLTEKSALRFSPAGIPIASGTLKHDSQQQQACIEREVEFEIQALAVGEISERFLQIELGVNTVFTGFLARKSRNSKSLIFHIIKFETYLLS